MAGRPYLAAPAATLEILKKYDLHTQKRYGQNFLIDAHIPEKITEAAQVKETDCILEIGPGIGTLTQFLAQKAGKVIAVEIDEYLIPVLEETLSGYDNAMVLQADILKVDLRKLLETYSDGLRIKVVANLPYYITTPILMTMLEARLPVVSYTVMVQKEVADRMQAGPGGKEYGALSLAVQYYTEPRIVMQVPPTCFLPRPKVGSTVIQLNCSSGSNSLLTDPEPQRRDASACSELAADAKLAGSLSTGRPRTPVLCGPGSVSAEFEPQRRDTAANTEFEEHLFGIIRAAFGQRRKTLYNALKNSGDLSLSGDQIRGALESCGFRPDIRGEALGLEDFIRLTDELYKER